MHFTLLKFPSLFKRKYDSFIFLDINTNILLKTKDLKLINDYFLYRTRI